jgi:hypothetical protein
MDDGTADRSEGPGLQYLSWCKECFKVTRHQEGACQEHLPETTPRGFPRPAIMVTMVPPKGRAA